MAEPKDDGHRVIFGVDASKSVVLLGVPAAGWEYMRTGKAHTFDLRKVGVPIQIVLFGGRDRAEILAFIHAGEELLQVDVALNPEHDRQANQELLQAVKDYLLLADTDSLTPAESRSYREAMARAVSKVEGK